MFDQMHTLDLGTHQCMVPSVMRDLVEKPGVFEGQTRGGRLNKAYVKYRKWCKDNQIRSVVRSKFRVDIWCKNKYPQITQLQAKAAALRSMTYWLKGICNRNTATDHDKVRALMVSGFCDADMQCRCPTIQRVPTPRQPYAGRGKLMREIRRKWPAAS